MIKLANILPADFAIITTCREDSEEIGKIIREHYPHLRDYWGWNTSSLYTYGIYKNEITCSSLNLVEKQGIKLYKLSEIHAILQKGEKAPDLINNTYTLY